MDLSNLLGQNWAETLTIAKEAFLPMVKTALLGTIPLTIITFVLGLVIAFITALFRLSGNKFLNGIARFYVSIIRGTPLLVQLFIIFYGLPTIGVTISPYISAVIGFSLSVGAYASEIIRGSIQSIDKGQWEAAYSIGMSYNQTLKRIIIPQAARVSLPPLSNTFISLVKDTSLASLILVSEMFRTAQEIAASNYKILLIYTEAAIIYWIICFFLSIIQGRLEARVERYVAK
jgi:L-cystine transport system permease protein